MREGEKRLGASVVATSAGWRAEVEQAGNVTYARDGWRRSLKMSDSSQLT
jgi:hypothetical protein